MTDFLVIPDPKITVSHVDVTELSLLSFHVIVIIEPDPETWMAFPQENMSKTLALFNQGLSAELFTESNIYLDNPDIIREPDELQEPHLLWIRYMDDDHFFEGSAFLSNAIFRLSEFDDFTHLEIYLQGIKLSHPNWNFAVVGAMFEDDVIRVANFISELGFPTTVVARQCISRNAFINLDELARYKDWLDQYRIRSDDPQNGDDPFEF